MSEMFYEGDVIVIQENKLYIKGEFEDYVYSISGAWDILESYYRKDQCLISLNSSGTLFV